VLLYPVLLYTSRWLQRRIFSMTQKKTVSAIKVWLLLKNLLFLTALLVVCGTMAHADTLMIDQSNSVTPNYSTSIQFAGSIGQEFTPTLTSLNFVELKTQDFGNPNGINGIGATLRVNIRIGTIVGTIIGTSGDVVLPDDFAYNHDYRGGDLFGGLVTTFNFATPVSLTPGSLYVIEAIVVSGDNWGLGGTDASDNYAGGRAIHGGQPTANDDLYFREGIQSPAVPEPATMVLLGTGLAGIAATLKRRKKQLR